MRDEDSGDCIICPRGTYSDITDATSCTPCPEGKTTRYEETSNANLCFGNTLLILTASAINLNLFLKFTELCSEIRYVV